MPAIRSHAIRPGHGLGRSLRLAWHEHPSGGIRGCRRLRQPVEVVGEPLAECGGVTDRSRIDGEEQLAEIGRGGRVEQTGDPLAECRTGEDAGEDVHREGQAVALVTGGLLESAEGEQGAVQRGLGVRGG